MYMWCNGFIHHVYNTLFSILYLTEGSGEAVAEGVVRMLCDRWGATGSSAAHTQKYHPSQTDGG